jgi:hypothetical protein
MDDPMARSRLDRVTGTQPIGAPDPKLGPLLFSVKALSDLFACLSLRSGHRLNTLKIESQMLDRPNVFQFYVRRPTLLAR